MAIKALMLDVDGVLIDGRPHDGLPWQASLEADLGLPPAALHQHFFAPFWEDIVLGRAGLLEHLAPALQKIAPHLSPSAFLDYWFERDSRLVQPWLPQLASLRSAGIRVYLATNQEHLRADYLMQHLGLAAQVEGIFYSAQLGVRKPDPQFFALVQAHVGFEAKDILLVDDSLPNIEAALHAGWQALHWNARLLPGILRAFTW